MSITFVSVLLSFVNRLGSWIKDSSLTLQLADCSTDGRPQGVRQHDTSHPAYAAWQLLLHSFHSYSHRNFSHHGQIWRRLHFRSLEMGRHNAQLSALFKWGDICCIRGPEEDRFFLYRAFYMFPLGKWIWYDPFIETWLCPPKGAKWRIIAWIWNFTALVNSY